MIQDREPGSGLGYLLTSTIIIFVIELSNFYSDDGRCFLGLSGHCEEFGANVWLRETSTRQTCWTGVSK